MYRLVWKLLTLNGRKYTPQSFGFSLGAGFNFRQAYKLAKRRRKILKNLPRGWSL